MPHIFRRSKITSQRAFTLIEILMVLALIGMLTGLIVVGVEAMRISSDKPSTPREVFWAAVTAARKQALMSGRDVRLAYVPATTDNSGEQPPGLIVSWDGTAGQAPPGQQALYFENMGDVICEFLSTQSYSAMLIGGEVVETETIPFVTFYGDGTCTPFRVQLRIGGSSIRLDIDPWTCAEMLTKAEGSS